MTNYNIGNVCYNIGDLVALRGFGNHFVYFNIGIVTKVTTVVFKVFWIDEKCFRNYASNIPRYYIKKLS